MAETAVSADDGATVNSAAITDDGAFADTGKGVNGRVGADGGTRVNVGFWTDAGTWELLDTLEMFGNGDERRQWIGDLDQGLAGDRKTDFNDYGGGVGFIQLGLIFRVFEKADIADLGLLKSSGRVNDDLRVAHDGAVNQFRQLLHSDAHARPSLFPLNPW